MLGFLTFLVLLDMWDMYRYVWDVFTLSGSLGRKLNPHYPPLVSFPSGLVNILFFFKKYVQKDVEFVENDRET